MTFRYRNSSKSEIQNGPSRSRGLSALIRSTTSQMARLGKVTGQVEQVEVHSYFHLVLGDFNLVFCRPSRWRPKYLKAVSLFMRSISPRRRSSFSHSAGVSFRRNLLVQKPDRFRLHFLARHRIRHSPCDLKVSLFLRPLTRCCQPDLRARQPR